jgi:hypothetical protein
VRVPTEMGGRVALPGSAQSVDRSRPDRVVGMGIPSSCTSAAVIAAVAAGGIITFDCSDNPVTIEMDATAKVVSTSSIVVLDGGGTVTLSGSNERRILYMNMCDQAQVWATSHGENQDHRPLALQNIGLTRGTSTSGQCVRERCGNLQH